MFDEDLFNVFDATASSTEKSGSQTASGSSRNAETKPKGHPEKPDNKRYERFLLADVIRRTADCNPGSCG